MAFRGLVEGDCGNPSSLIHLASHYVQDHGFKEEGIHRSFDPQGEFQIPDTKKFQIPDTEEFQIPDAENLVHQFLEEPACPQTFRMDSLLQEMRNIDQTIHPPITAPYVANELANLDTIWNDACLKSVEPLREFPDTWNFPVIQAEEKLSFVHDTHELGLDPKWAEEYVEQRIDASGDKSNVSEEDPKITYSKFMKFMRQEGDIPIESGQRAIASLDDTAENWIEQFHSDKQKTNDGVTDNATSDHAILNKMEEQLAVAGTWTDEFIKENDIENNDTYESMWDGINKLNAEEWSGSGLDYNPTFKEYEFLKTNPMKDLPNALEEGKRRLQAEDLPSAVLCFEAAAQQDENNVEAWLLLGKTQAENEQDSLAISALNRCLSLDPSNCVALMTLAASYVNESFHKQACLTLKEWLLKNEKYTHLFASNPKTTEQSHLNMSTLLFNQVYDEVKDLYIQAARMNPRDGIDADVQCGLGILFNLCCEYDKAADCFQAALQAQPEDSRLWNKLGATLANGQRSAEAINVYHRALELSPGFIRARYNLGISCVTLGAYKEAGEHLLTVLNQQIAATGPQSNETTCWDSKAMSNSIWTTLRFVILFMKKYDLMHDVESRNLSKLNKEFGIA